MLGFFAGMALRYPKTMAILAKVWKFALGGLIVGALIFSFMWWKGNLEDRHEQIGFDKAEQQFTEAVNAANERERETQRRLDQMTTAFGALAERREQAINLTVRPTIERIQDEVANDPRYAQCVVSNGVLDDINAGRAAVDASIRASNTSGD